jgi:hypothetical protein
MSEWKTRITKVQVVKPKAETGEACLVLVYPPGADMGKKFPLSRSEIVLGRGSDCDIQVDRDSVSRRHARVYRHADQWMVEDLQSTNGSYVNDVPIQKSILKDSDFLKIGAAIFKFLSGAGVESSYYEEIYRMTIIDGLTGAHNKRGVPRVPRARDRALRSPPSAAVAAHVRHRSLQVDQRHPRPPDRRRGAEGDVQAPARPDPPRGAPGPLRRRGVRRGPARDRPRRRDDLRRADPSPGRRRALRVRGRSLPGDDLDRASPPSRGRISIRPASSRWRTTTCTGPSARGATG